MDKDNIVQDNRTDVLKRIICCALFVLLFIMLQLQYSKVWIYYDDYGYLSLNYALNSWDVDGHEYTFSQLLYFIRWSFVYSNGRQAVMFLYLLIFKFGGLLGVRIAVAVFAGLIALLPVLVLRKMEPDFKLSLAAVLFLVSVFMQLGVVFQSDGAYWFAAAFPYIVPALLIYLTIMCILCMYNGDKVPFLACIASAFIAGFTQEQYYAANIMLVLCALIAAFLPERHVGGSMAYSEGIRNLARCRLRLTAMLIAAFAGGLPILLCPAAHNRMHNSSWYALNISGRTLADISEIMRCLYSEYNVYYVWLLFAVMLVLAVMLIGGTKKAAAKVLHIAFIAFTAYMIYYFAFNIRVRGFAESDTLLCLIYTAAMSIELLIFLLMKQKLVLASVYMGAAASCGCLTLVPSTDIQFRCMLPFIFISMPVLAYVIHCAARRKCGLAITLLMAVFWFAGLNNMHNIYKGYSLNAIVNEYNDALMQEAADEYHRTGNIPDEIVLYQLPDFRCRGRMQYEPGYGGISKWMAEYYGLPREIKLSWRDDTLTAGINLLQVA